MKQNTKPTVEEIKELYTECEKIYGPLQAQFEEDDKYYELDFKGLLDIPAEFDSEGVVLPTARDMVDACVDNTTVSNVKVSVSKKGVSIKSEEESETLRKFGLGVIHRSNVESTISPWQVSKKHFWIYGITHIKTVWDVDLWPGKPDQKGGESEDAYAARLDKWRVESSAQVPIVLQAVNPSCVMPDPFDGGQGFLFETQERLVYKVREKYPNWSNPKDLKVTEKVKCVSFWTPKWRCELYDDEPILKIAVSPHNYGFIPYTTIETGLGNIAKDNDPVKRYVGILRYIRQMLVSESSNYSLSDVVLKRTAWPWFTIEGDHAENVGEIYQKFGQATKLPPGTKIVPQIAQTPPDALERHMARTSDYITAHAAPNSVRGLGETGVRSGTDRRQIMSAAATRYLYATEAFEHGAAKVLQNCAKVFKNVIPGDMRVWARTPTDEFDIEIKKEDIHEPFTFYVEFAPVSEEDEYRRHDDLERLTSQGIVTKKWARTQMSNVDPIQMELDEEIERLKLNPALEQLKSQYLAGKLQEAFNKRMLAENPEQAIAPTPGAFAPTNQTAEGPTPPRTSVATPPNIPTPGSAEAIQGELAKLRRPNAPTQQGLGGGGNNP